MDLLKENIRKLYYKFLIPSLGSAMVMSIYTLTDAIVIGKGVGSDALAALSFTTPLLCVLMSTGILFGVGGSVQMNISRGLGNDLEARRHFTVSFGCMVIIGLFLWAVYSFKITDIVRSMGANDNLLPLVISYMKYINYFIPFALFSNYIAIFIRADNDPNRAMFGVMLGGLLNIILDIVYVFPLQMGIGGAALASALGMMVQVIVGVSHFFSSKNNLKFAACENIVKNTVRIIQSGIPSFFNEFANGFIVFLFNIQILRYCGETALSVYSVISNCVILFNSLFTGVGQAVQPIISINYGAKNASRIYAAKRLAFTTIIIMGIVFSLCGLIFPVNVCNIFLKVNSDISEIANYAIRIYFIAFLPLGINLLSSYYLQSVLCSRESLIISILRNVVLSGAGIILFPVAFGANSLWFVIPSVEIIVMCISVILLLKSKKKLG